jgi:hypothetical protein
MSAPPTPDETATLDAWIVQALARDARGACVRCGTPMTAKHQVGRCIYVDPCGCRLGQGRLMDGQGRPVARLTYPQEEQA